MPIHVPPGLQHLSESEFREITYEVMEKVFAVHNEMGGLFDESIYQQAIFKRLSNALVELPIEISFEDFRKRYYLDLLVAQGALFELKAAESFTDRHRSQILHYLLMLEFSHGKLVNMRG